MKILQHILRLKNKNTSIILLLTTILTASIFSSNAETTKKYIIDENSSYYVTNETWLTPLQGGDTIFVLSTRTKPLRFKNINGSSDSPVTVINLGGQVVIDGPQTWGAITFENCSNIKISGNGHPDFKYGFTLSASKCGLAFSELSSDCEAEFIKIDHEGFYGIFAKKDYGGNPPSPAPIFSNLVIHDCFIQNVTEGMYLGETKSPGMEFKHVKIYNNIVLNTGRESMQIANMVEDVEIFNNTLMNSGQDGEIYQSNILQIGDNSVARVYNNILIGAPSFGIIALGIGNIDISNNFIAYCKGIFTDNRIFAEKNSPIEISGNYFSDIISTEIIKNMNELNFINASENKYSTNLPFFKNASGNENNFILLNNQLVSIAPITFTNPDKNDYSLAEGVSINYKEMGAPGGPEFINNSNPLPVIEKKPEQIMLTADMLVDEVTGSSYWSGEYLIDEQYCTPENNAHPVSQSWKPYWNMNLAPYHIYFDLKYIHRITNISLHDMHNTKNLEISVGEPGNWQSLFIDPCNKYNTWVQHTTDISTRYIRLSMTESVFAAVNELVVYGYSEEENTTVEKSGKSNNLTTAAVNFEENDLQIRLNKNPVINKLDLTIPEKLSRNFNLDLFDMNGNNIFSEIYTSVSKSVLRIDISRYNLMNGMYLIKYSNQDGISKTIKFTKSNF